MPDLTCSLTLSRNSLAVLVVMDGYLPREIISSTRKYLPSTNFFILYLYRQILLSYGVMYKKRLF